MKCVSYGCDIVISENYFITVNANNQICVVCPGQMYCKCLFRIEHNALCRKITISVVDVYKKIHFYIVNIVNKLMMDVIYFNHKSTIDVVNLKTHTYNHVVNISRESSCYKCRTQAYY